MNKAKAKTNAYAEAFVVASKCHTMGGTKSTYAVGKTAYATREAAEDAAKRLAEDNRRAFLSIGGKDAAERCTIAETVDGIGHRHFTFNSWGAFENDRDTSDYWVETCLFVG